MFIYSVYGGDVHFHVPELLTRTNLQVCLPEFHHKTHKINTMNFQIHIQLFSGFNSLLLGLSFIPLGGCAHSRLFYTRFPSSLSTSYMLLYNLVWDIVQGATHGRNPVTRQPCSFPKTVHCSLKTSSWLLPWTLPPLSLTLTDSRHPQLLPLTVASDLHLQPWSMTITHNHLLMTTAHDLHCDFSRQLPTTVNQDCRLVHRF